MFSGKKMQRLFTSCAPFLTYPPSVRGPRFPPVSHDLSSNAMNWAASSSEMSPRAQAASNAVEAARASEAVTILATSNSIPRSRRRGASLSRNARNKGESPSFLHGRGRERFALGINERFYELRRSIPGSLRAAKGIAALPGLERAPARLRCIDFDLRRKLLGQLHQRGQIACDRVFIRMLGKHERR